MRSKKYGAVFILTKKILRLYMPRTSVTGDIPAEPVVYVGHHQNLKGPLMAAAWFNQPVRLWVYNVFCDYKSCYNQYANYTFSQRMKWPKPLAIILSSVVSLYVPRLMRSMRAIPVFRGSTKSISVTMKLSEEALLDGESIMIFPDIDYTSSSPEMGEMNTGFINLEKNYFKHTGKHLAFVPLQLNERISEFRICKPVYHVDGETSVQAKKRISMEIISELNRNLHS